MNRMLRTALVATLLTPAVALLAQASEPANVKQLQHDRHEHYEKLGENFKVVRDQVRADKPDLAAIKSAAKFVNDAAAQQQQWFPAGSGPEAGKTDALPAIWNKPAEFKAAMKMFSDAAPKLQSAANSGNVAAVKTAFGDVGKACKNCHEQFRAEDD